jgi:sec-independent protein translocase protein TatB
VIDLGISKLALIGAVALIVIGPEKLPRVARTVGTLIGKAQRYVADVKAEVNRSMELEELKKLKETVETSARDIEQTVHSTATEFEQQWSEATAGLTSDTVVPSTEGSSWSSGSSNTSSPRPKKNWRLKRGAVPQWYKARAGVRTHVQSGAARVARYRPRPFN